jgi:hypothetical protein
MLAAGTLFALLSLLAVVSALVAGSPVLLINAVIPGAVATLFFLIALRQRIRLDRKGVRIEGLGSAGRTIKWADVQRLELTDASKWRLGPRLVVKSGRALPVPAQWRIEDSSRLPESVLAWSRWARIEVVGERLTGRRWPIFALIGAGVLSGLLVALG